jgi:PAS domain S-box-containing protein
VRYIERPVYARPALLIVAALAAISLAIAAPMAAGASATLMLLVIVVTAAAWYGGPRLGFITTAVGSAMTLVFQHAGWQLPATNFYVALLLYAIAGALISRLYGTLQSAGARLDAQQALHNADLEQARRGEAIARQRYEAVDRALRYARMAYWECDPATGQIRRGDESAEAYDTAWVLPRVTTIDAARAMVHPDDAHRVEDQAREAWRSGRDLSLQCRVRFPNGALRWIEVRGAVAADEQGRPTMLHGLIADIEEEKAGEEALRASEERFRSLVDHAPVLIWGNDANGSLFVNRACVTFTGCSADELQRTGWRAVLHADDAEDYLAQYEHAFQQKALFEAQVRIRRHDGEYRWFKSAAVPRYAGDVFMGYAGSSVDITEIRQYMSELARAEHTLRDADRRKDQFLAVLSHELRNPLNPIRNAVAVLGAGPSQERDVLWARGVIERQVGQLARLLDDLMDVSRITQNKLELRLQPIDIKEVVGVAVEASKPLLDAREHRLEVVVPPKPLYVQADPARLAQVLSNLINNAAKFTDKGGQIRVRASERAGQVIVSVKDNGMGISAQFLPRIFDMFTQGEYNPSRPRDGLGIGLGLARGLVAMHGGRLEAHSEGTGKGSEFIVTLPAAAQAVATAAAMAHRPISRQPEQAGLRILVADDVRDSAEGLSVLLRIGGNDVRIATDGAEALNLAADFQPEVAVLDIGMPKLSGYEVARQIRQQPWGENTVLIALTGWGQQDDIRRALDVGFNYHMVKPVNIPQLQELLEQLAARKARDAHAA